MTLPARPPLQRKRDVLDRLEHDVDAWVATANPDSGTPYLVPLSFLWHDGDLLIATPASSPTSRNLKATGNVRLSLGPTRDVILIEGTARVLPATEITDEIGDAFAVKTGFDPRRLTTPYLYLRIQPRRLQAWREANELDGRDLMRNGQWLIS